MRRMRRYNCNPFAEDQEDGIPLPAYFLRGKLNHDYENSPEKHPDITSYKGYLHNDKYDNGYRSDEADSNSISLDSRMHHKSNHGPNEDNEDDVYEVISERYLASPSSSQNRLTPKRFSDSDISNSRAIKLSHRKPEKKIICKFCASSKQFGSCPCPIHLPTVQSRYMREFQDNARNAITINVFKNGDYRATPTMIHIQKFGMRSMEDIIKIVDKFIRFPVGYAYALYTLLGDLVEDPAELEPYEMYVVVNNCKKQFIPMEYGLKRPSSMDMGQRRRTIALAPFIRG